MYGKVQNLCLSHTYPSQSASPRCGAWQQMWNCLNVFMKLFLLQLLIRKEWPLSKRVVQVYFLFLDLVEMLAQGGNFLEEICEVKLPLQITN